MKKCKNIINIHSDVGIVVIIIMIFIGGIFLDQTNVDFIPKELLINSDDRTNLKLYVFSAQVSLSILGTALIAILSGLFKQSIYGINVLKYLTTDRPLIFKHKVSIIIQMIIIFISYICTALNDCYNVLISIFMISIIINILMIRDVFSIYNGYEYLKKEIYKYILIAFNRKTSNKKYLKESIITGLKNDTLLTIKDGRISMIEDHLNLFYEIMINITNYNKKYDKELLLMVEKNLADIFKDILQNHNLDMVKFGLEQIQVLYEKCNNHNSSNEPKLYISKLYKGIERDIIRATIEIIKHDGVIYCYLIPYIYNNMNFSQENDSMIPLNNIDLKYYSEQIYDKLTKTELKGYSKKNLYELKYSLFTKLEANIKTYKDKYRIEKISEYRIEKIEQIYIHLFRYITKLIDNNEHEILKTIFFNKVFNSYNKKDKEEIEYIYMVIIYLYTLDNITEKYNNGKLKNNIRDLKNKSINNIYEFLNIYIESELNEKTDHKVTQKLLNEVSMPYIDNDELTKEIQSSIDRLKISNEIIKSIRINK